MVKLCVLHRPKAGALEVGCQVPFYDQGAGSRTVIFSASCLSKSNFTTCLSSGTPRVGGWPEIASKVLGNEIVP